MPIPTVNYHFGDSIAPDPWSPFYSAVPNGELQTPTPTKFAIKDDLGNRIVFHGDFTIDNGVITGGTVTGFSAFSGAAEVSTGAGYDIPATTLLDAIENSQNGSGGPFFDLILYDIPLVQVGSSQDDLMTGTGGGGKIFGAGGNDSIFAFGGNETIHGGKGNDFVSGGKGFDKLFGDAGRDVFHFADDTHIDRVMDFEVNKDLIALDRSDFGALGVGFVEKSEFTIGTSAKTADQHLIYDKSTGALYYDQDGIDVAAQVQIAKLSAGLNLTAGHFFIYDD